MWKNNKETIIASAIVIALVGLFIWIFTISNTETPEDPTQPKGDLVTFEGSTITEEADGKLTWSVTAEQIKVNPKTKEVYLTNMKANFYKEGKELVVTAPRGHMTSDHNTFQLAGGVVAVDQDGAELKTDSVNYNNKSKKLSSETAFTFTNKEATITGDTFEADTVLQKVIAKGHAKLEKK